MTQYLLRMAIVVALGAMLVGACAPLSRSNPSPIAESRTPIPLLPAPTTVPAEPRQSVFGLNSHIASRYPNYTTLDQPAAVAGGLAIGWVREDVQWSRVEPEPGSFDWSWHDQVFVAHRRNGIHIIGVIGPAVGWATPEPGDPPSGVSFYPPDTERYAAFAGALAARYRGVVDAWEIWNEPENPLFWRPAPDPVAYARLLIAASAAIRAVDPEVTILNGGVVPYDPGFLTTLGEAGAWQAFDALSVHPYVDPFTPEAAQIDVVGIQNVRQLAARFGDKPIWVTEYGWGTGPCERDPKGLTGEEQQANYLVRGAALLRGGGAERILWYNFKDHEQPCYGLVRGAGGPEDYSRLKPAALALRVLSEQIGSAEPLGPQDVMPRQEILSFDDAAGWGTPFPASAPPLVSGASQVFEGEASGQISYQFGDSANNYIAFPRTQEAILPPDTTRLGLWVYGDGSGHIVHLRLIDQEGEVFQFRLGFLGAPGWEFLHTSITGIVDPGNRITAGDGELSGTLRVRELVVDDHPDRATGSGTIFVDELTAFQGSEVYAERFVSEPAIVDVVWALEESSLQLPVNGSSVVVTSRDGASRTVEVEGNKVTVAVGPAPIYIRQGGAGGS